MNEFSHTQDEFQGGVAVANPPCSVPLGQITINLRVNGQSRTLTLEPRVTLLDALREHLHLA